MMNKPLTSEDIEALPTTERLRLIELLWDSLDGEMVDAQMPDWQKAEIDSRLDALDSGASKGAPWSEVRGRIGRS